MLMPSGSSLTRMASRVWYCMEVTSCLRRISLLAVMKSRRVARQSATRRKTSGTSLEAVGAVLFELAAWFFAISIIGLTFLHPSPRIDPDSAELMFVTLRYRHPDYGYDLLHVVDGGNILGVSGASLRA